MRIYSYFSRKKILLSIFIYLGRNKDEYLSIPLLGIWIIALKKALL